MHRGVASSMLPRSTYGCIAMTTAEHTSGEDKTFIWVSTAGVEAIALPLRVWYPTTVEILIRDSRELNQINGIPRSFGAQEATQSIQCNTSAFQSTHVTAVVDGLDVAPLAAFVSADPIVAVFENKNQLRGISPGAVQISLNVCPWTRSLLRQHREVVHPAGDVQVAPKLRAHL